MLQTNSKTTVPVFTGKIPSLKPTPENVAEQQPQPAAAEVEIIPNTNDIKISNSDFIGHIFSDLPKNTYAAVCTKSGDPTKNGWSAKRADLYSNQLASTYNNYLNTSSFKIMDDGLFNVRKDNFSSTHFLLLDDFGTKIAFDRLNDFKPSWLLETSPGNFQAGIIFKEPITDAAVVNQLQKAIIAAGLCDPGANGPTNRWGRLRRA